MHMLKHPKVRGYALAFLATVAMSNVFIFSKAALNEVDLFQFGFYWFGFAIVWNVLYAIPARRYVEVRNLSRSSIRALVIIGLLELGGTGLFFIAIDIVENPAIVSFLVNLTPLFVTLMGLVFLRERFNIFEGLGFLLTLAGAFIISYKIGGSMEEVFIPGTGYIIVSCFLLAIGFIISKKFITNIDPGILAINRVLYLFAASAILLYAYGSPLAVSWKGFYNMLIGSFVGPFLTAFSQYSALRYIEASRTSIIQSTKSLFVLVGAYVYFNTFPETHQVLGGLITIGGVFLVTLGRWMIRRGKKAPAL
jgi:drug/metabolite transporter (DMT)-like permease